MPAHIRSRKFCCCLPVRLGVFALSLVGMVGGSFVAAMAFIQISQLKQHPLGKGEIVALWLHAGMFTILAILSIFGFVGALTKNRRMISTFAIALAVHLGFSVASGIFTLVSVFRQNVQENIDKCLAAGGESATAAQCKTGITIMKAVMVAVYVLTWMVQLYSYFIVERYSDQLEDEVASQTNTVVVQQINGAQVAPAYSAFAPAYPFSSPVHSHGARAQDPSNRV